MVAIWQSYSGVILKDSEENTFPLGRTVSITPGYPLYVEEKKNGWRWEYVHIPGRGPGPEEKITATSDI